MTKMGAQRRPEVEIEVDLGAYLAWFESARNDWPATRVYHDVFNQPLEFLSVYRAIQREALDHTQIDYVHLLSDLA